MKKEWCSPGNKGLLKEVFLGVFGQKTGGRKGNHLAVSSPKSEAALHNLPDVCVVVNKGNISLLLVQGGIIQEQQEAMGGSATVQAVQVLSLTVFAVALSPPRYLSFSELSHSSVRVSWAAASPAVRAHHLTYVSGRGGNAGQVSPQGLGRGKGTWEVNALFSFSCVVQGELVCWQSFESEMGVFAAVVTTC